MHFTPQQVAVTFLSFIVAVSIATFFHLRDKRKGHSYESFTVLMSVFFWSAILALFLKMGIDMLIYYFPQITSSKSFFTFSIFLETLTKAAALIIGLDIAGKKFNELSDGVLYATFAALGFNFLENIFYLLTTTETTSLLSVLLGRSLFSFGAHLFIVIFGVMYAGAYLQSNSIRQRLKLFTKRVKPYQIHKLFLDIYKQYKLLTPLFLIFAPFIIFTKIILLKRNTRISELLIGGFITTYYLHLSYDILLDIPSKIFNLVLLVTIGVFVVFVYNEFQTLDVE